MELSRRRFLGFLAAPAIVRAASLMPVKAFLPEPQLMWGDEVLLTPGGWIKPSIITKETLKILQNNLYTAKRINPYFEIITRKPIAY